MFGHHLLPSLSLQASMRPETEKGLQQGQEYCHDQHGRYEKCDPDEKAAKGSESAVQRAVNSPRDSLNIVLGWVRMQEAR
jgi:hypothetical protein